MVHCLVKVSLGIVSHLTRHLSLFQVWLHLIYLVLVLQHLFHGLAEVTCLVLSALISIRLIDDLRIHKFHW